jgi:hypothetical protein
LPNDVTENFATSATRPGFAFHMTAKVGKANGTRMFFVVVVMATFLTTMMERRAGGSTSACAQG